MRLLAVTFLLLLVLTSAGYAVFRSVRVQSFIASKAADYFSKKLHATLRIGELDVAFPTLVVAGEVFISDQHGDTLLYARRLTVDIFNIVNRNRRFELGGISVYHGRFRLVQRQDEKDLNVQFLIDAFDTGPSPKGAKPFVNMVRHIDLQGVDFTYQDLPLGKPGEEIDFSDLHCRRVFASVDSLIIIRDTISMQMRSLTLAEKSGFYVKNLSAFLRVSPLFVDMHRLDLQTLRSHVKGDFAFQTKDYRDYSNFEKKVGLKGNFDLSSIWLSDLVPFASELNSIQRNIKFSGAISGTEDNLKGTGISLLYGKNTVFRGNVKFKGLPDWDNTFTSLDIHRLETDAEDLATLPMYPFTSRECLSVPREIKRLGKIHFAGFFDGFESNFVSIGKLQTELGSLDIDMKVKTDTKDGLATYNGNISTSHFQLGKYYAVQQAIGALAANVQISGRGLKLSNVNTHIEGKLSHLEFYGYDYKKLFVNGDFSKNIFTGQFSVEDTNAILDFKGDIDMRGTLPRYRFATNITRLDLDGLGWIKNNRGFSLSSQLQIDITGDDADNISGTAEASQTVQYKNNEALLIKRIRLQSASDNGIRKITIDSDVLDGNIEGKFNFGDLPAWFLYIAHQQFPSYIDSVARPSAPLTFTWTAKTRNSMSVSRLFLPGMVFYPQTLFKGSVNGASKQYNILLQAPRMELGGLMFKGIGAELSSAREVGFLITTEKILLTESVAIENMMFSGKAYTDSLLLDLDWKNISGKKNYGDLTAGLRFLPGKKMRGIVSRDQIYLGDTLWNFDRDNSFFVDSTGYYFKHFNLSAGKQRIGIETEQMAGNYYTQRMFFDNFELYWLNPLMEKNGTSLGGTVNGTGDFSRNEGHLVFSSTMNISALSINNESFGDASLIAQYNNKDESIAINGKIMRGESPALSVSGFYFPVREEQSLDMEIRLFQFPMRNLEGYVKDIFSDLRGYASGALILSGNAAKPVLKGEVEILRGGFKVDYLNVDYTFSDKITFAENSIVFNHIRFADPQGKFGILNGSILHDYFSDLKLNLDLDVKKLMCLNLSSSQNETVYGKAFVTGIARISGKPNALVFDINARSESGTILNIPLYGAEEVRQNDLIQFISHDTSTMRIKRSDRLDNGGLQLNFDLQMTQDAEIQLIFDPKVGDVISGNGDGNIKMNINTLGQFQMFGNYTIRDGKYLFTLQNIINKKFIVGTGSSITWTGDPFGADININAVYRLRTSLAEILPDSSKQRVPVECNLFMTEKLMKPAIKFDIQLPNVDQRRREEFQAAVNSQNEAELNKQVFSLLMLGRFFPATERTNSSVTSGVSSNTNELLSNQVSNWLGNMSKKVNLGFNYKNDQVSNREVQLTLSKELFNSRVNIDGNVGVTNNPSAASNIIGDVNVDYKVSKDGRFRVRAYHQSNQYLALTNNSPYTQGLGIFYREEFENLPELLGRYKRLLLLKRIKETEQ
jgi:hypothetical protein